MSRPQAGAVVIGKTDFSDAHNSIKIDHLLVNNANTTSAAGGLQLNYVLDSDVYAVADSAGGAAGIALEQTQFSRISGAASAVATGGAAMLLRNRDWMLMDGLRGRCRALNPEAEQHIVHRILQPRIGLMQLASRLGGKLTELVPVADMSQSAKNQFRTHGSEISLLICR